MPHLRISIFGIFILWLFASFPARAAATPSEPEAYRFSLYGNWGAPDNVSFIPFNEKLLDVFSASESVRLRLEYQQDREEVYRTLRAAVVEFLYADTWDAFVYALRRNYKPFLAPQFFGKDKIALCLYVSADGNITSMDQLKGKKILTSYNKDAYYSLRSILNAAPESVFGGMNIFPDAMTALYSVSTGRFDAAIVNETNADFFAMKYPDTWKTLKQLKCGPAWPPPPIMHSQKVQNDFLKAMAGFYSNEQIIQLLTQDFPDTAQMKIKFIPVTEKDYAELYQFFAQGYNKGWSRDYDKWLMSVEPMR